MFLVNIRVPFPACCSTLVTSLKLIGLNVTSYFSAILVGHVADCLFHHRGEALGFSVLRFWLFFRSVSRFWCSLQFSNFPFFLAFDFRFSRKILTGFRI